MTTFLRKATPTVADSVDKKTNFEVLTITEFSMKKALICFLARLNFVSV